MEGVVAESVPVLPQGSLLAIAMDDEHMDAVGQDTLRLVLRAIDVDDVELPVDPPLNDRHRRTAGDLGQLRMSWPNHR